MRSKAWRRVWKYEKKLRKGGGSNSAEVFTGNKEKDTKGEEFRDMGEEEGEIF